MTKTKFRYECKNCGKKGKITGSIKKLISNGCLGITEENEICGSKDFIISPII